MTPTSPNAAPVGNPSRVLANTKFDFLFGFWKFCSDKGFLRSDLLEEIRHLAFYNAGMPNIRIVKSVIGRAQRSIGRVSALPGLYKTTPVNPRLIEQLVQTRINRRWPSDKPRGGGGSKNWTLRRLVCASVKNRTPLLRSQDKRASFAIAWVKQVETPHNLGSVPTQDIPHHEQIIRIRAAYPSWNKQYISKLNIAPHLFLTSAH